MKPLATFVVVAASVFCAGLFAQESRPDNAQTSRLPLGSVKSRTLKAASYSRTLPFAPDGDYVLMEYETRFEFKPLATETLTTMKDRDNTWKVAGYFIK